MVDLSGNKGFPLSHDISSVANATKLDFSNCYLGGALAGLLRHTVRRSEMRSESRAGPLPKMWPVSLEILNLSGGKYSPHEFTGGIPVEWSSMTNLKELKMSKCSLDGESA